jgi:hypothetical protein
MANSWNVDLVQSTHGRTAWAACVAMLLNHRDSTSLTDGDVAVESGVEDRHGGSVASDSDYSDILSHYLLFARNQLAPTPREWDDLLAPGPVIAAVYDRAIVVGAVGDIEDPQDCQIHVLDPVYGEGWVPYLEFGDRFGFHPGVELMTVQP